MKQKDKRTTLKTEDKSLQELKINSFPKNFSSLKLAYHLTERVSQLGFDWPNLSGVLEKLDEEMKEFKEVLSLHQRRRIREEMGDLLFVLVNLARVLQIDPERALRNTIKKFVIRFRYMERSLHKKGKSFHQSTLTEMDQLWEEAKQKERGRSRKQMKDLILS